MSQVRAPRSRIPAPIKAKGLRLAKKGEPAIVIARKTGVNVKTVYSWLTALRNSTTTKLTGKRGPYAKRAKRTNVAEAIRDHLTEIGNMIRKTLPDLARFTLTTGLDGKASIEYAVRQTTEVDGQVKL